MFYKPGMGHANVYQAESHIKTKRILLQSLPGQSEHQKTPRHCKHCHWEFVEIAVTFTHVDTNEAHSENYKGESERNWVTTRLNQSVGGHQCTHELVGVQKQNPLTNLSVPHGDIRP